MLARTEALLVDGGDLVAIHANPHSFGHERQLKGTLRLDEGHDVEPAGVETIGIKVTLGRMRHQ
jgi:hypothetical protein